MMPRYLKILNLEDCIEDSLQIVDELIRHDIEPDYKRVETLEDMRAELDANQYDMIISDFMLEGFTGLEALDMVNEMDIETPFILVSGVIDDEKAVTALRSGAADFISKSNLARLSPAIIREVKEARDRRERKLADRKLKMQEERYAALFAHMSDGLLVFEKDDSTPPRHICVDTNQAALQIEDKSREEVIGQDADELFKHLVGTNLAERLEGIDESTPIIYLDNIKCLHGIGESYRSYQIYALSKEEAIVIYRDVTNEIRLREAIKRSEEQYRMLIENQGEGIGLINQDDEFLYVNPAAEKIFDAKPGTLQGRKVTEFLEDEGKIKLADVTEKHQKGETSKYILKIKTENNNNKFLYVTSNLYYDSEGDFVGYMALFRDDTERVQLEQQLKDSEQQFRMILDLLPIGAVLIEAEDRTVTYANPKALAMTGRTGDNVVGIDCHEFYCDPEQSQDGYDKLTKAQPVYTARRELNCPRAGSIPTLRSVLETTFGGGRQFLETIVDISEQVKAEHSIMSNLDFLQTLIDTIPNPVFYKDVNGIYRGCNKSFAKDLIGLKPEEIIGKTVFDMGDAIPAELAAQYEVKDDELFDSKEPQFYEAQVNCANGIVRHYAFSKALYYNQDGEIAGIVGVMLDISQQKDTEMQLRQVQKLEAIGQLAAGIAHEINTPVQYIGDNINFMKKSFKDVVPLLEAIQRLTQAYEDGRVPEELHKEIAELAEKAQLDFLMEDVPDAIVESQDGVERVAKIVRAMKEFSHPGSDEKTPFNLNEALQSTITVARNEWKYVADLETFFSDELPLVPGLVADLNQVFLNLIINAAHAIEAKYGKDSSEKGKIAVSTELYENNAVIGVSDTGTGIPPDIQNRVFDPFFTTKEVGKGTGQGLAIAYNVVVEKHGGTIELDSEVGLGTAFIIKLPLD